MKCLNFGCNRNLTTFDINRHVRKFSKYRLCIYCRTHIKKVTDLRCLDCGKSFPHNGQKIYCGQCNHTGRLIRERMRQYERSKKKTKECIMCFGLISLESHRQKICSDECLNAYQLIYEEIRRVKELEDRKKVSSKYNLKYQIIKPQTIN